MASLVRGGLRSAIKTSFTSHAARFSPYLAFRTQPATDFSVLPPSNQFHSSAITSDKMPSAQAFLDIVKARRTYYPLKKESPISDARIQEIVKEAILHAPSSFNSQTTRVLLLLKGEHEKLWEITKEVLKGVTPAENFPATEQKIDMFKGAYGTVLFFNYRPTVQEFQEKFAIYADKFPPFAEQTNAMSQFIVWSALEAEGLGGNLQHYSPLIDQKVAAEWKLPQGWELNAQLVFGTPVGDAGEKTFLPVEGERLIVHGA